MKLSIVIFLCMLGFEAFGQISSFQCAFDFKNNLNHPTKPPLVGKSENGETYIVDEILKLESRQVWLFAQYDGQQAFLGIGKKRGKLLYQTSASIVPGQSISLQVDATELDPMLDKSLVLVCQGS